MSPNQVVPLDPAALSESERDVGENSLQQGSDKASSSGPGACVIQQWVDSTKDAEDPTETDGENRDDSDLCAYRAIPGPEEEERQRRSAAPSPEKPRTRSPPPSPPHNN